MNIIVLGPQGSGKSTQAKILADKLGLFYISAGEISREIANEPTHEGQEVKKAMDQGELTPFEILASHLKSTIEKNSNGNGFVFDGWPRNKEEFDFWQEYLKEKNWVIDQVFFINLPETTALERIGKRVISEKRSDDTPEAIKERLQIYHDETQPIIDHYRQSGILAEIDGAGTIEQVTKLIDEKLLQLK